MDNNDFLLRSIKILDIGYITVIYFILGLVFSRLFDLYFSKHNPKNDNKKTIYKVGIELVFMIWILGIIIYIVRNLVELIPSPFDGLFGFNHYLVKELGSAAVFTMILLSYTYHFKHKLDYFNDRINKEFKIFK